MNKKIQIYPNGSMLHSAYNFLRNKPLEGYSIINKIKKRTLKKRTLNKAIVFLNKKFKLNRIYKKVRRKPSFPEADIVWSMAQIYNGDEPWVLDILDNPFALTRYSYKDLIRSKKEIKNALISERCKAIICENKISTKIIGKIFGKDLLRKVKQIRAGAEPRFNKKLPEGTKRLLFMGSLNNPNDFYIKGGVETIMAFNMLNSDNLELIIRCKVPKEIRKKISKNKKIRLIEKRVPEEELNRIYSNTYLLISPGHTYMLMSTIEAMSYGIPIIGIKSWATKEYIIDGKTGFLENTSKKMKKYYNSPEYPTNIRNKDFIRDMKKGDPLVAISIAKKIKLLIDNEKKRDKMSENTKNFFLRNFNIKTRRQKIKKLFDSLTKSS
jgi:glycosyltransferase involved in cell wall biosynthesis